MSSVLRHFLSPEATMALKLIKIAEKLSNNLDDFALYVTDVTMDSFAVNDKGELLLIDLDSVLVVDKLAVKGSELTTWNGMHESQFNECRNQTFRECNKDTEPQLCRHANSDHNYYVICRQLLSQDAYDGSEKRRSFVNGLLHDMPDTARNDWELDYLLSESVMPTRQRGRMQVVHKMIEALSNLQSEPVKH
ncbi:divergent protein kinase domain 2A-like [Mya arenaria]|uniref:divergent protein kinase domain 2A-like n=1 Tax=Mya arenaria TaxID=6604 RepID=UPI0022E6F680|nr:divergent protein kinase domain 2A-like [Mya arenaria]